jgi:monoterpene epsilon-lactone hydrolase
MPPGNDALAQLFALAGQRTSLPTIAQDLGLLRTVMEDITTVASEPTLVTYEHVPSAGTCPALWHIPISAQTSKNVILYFHGGGFLTNSLASHRKMVGHLAKRANCKALALEYRLAPESRFPSQIDDAVEAYKWLLKQGYRPENIATAVSPSNIPASNLVSLIILEGRLSRRQPRNLRRPKTP